MRLAIRKWWRYVGGLLPAALLVGLLLAMLVYALEFQQREESYDAAALEEWVKEARVYRETLPGMIRHYWAAPSQDKAEAIRAHLAALGGVTRGYQSQLPLFPVIYHLELVLTPAPADGQHLSWDARYPRLTAAGADGRALKRRRIELCQEGDRQAALVVDYQLHAYDTRQAQEETKKLRLRWLTALAIAAIPLVAGWVYLFLRRERERELTEIRTQQEIDRAQRVALENELQRQEAERQKEEAERKALELRSQLYAGIGIMAGSYAHNIKNLLVRPNDLLGRCLENDGLPSDQRHHLQEVQHTLHTVTERLQQILRTLRRDPTQAVVAPLDLNALARDIGRNWETVAAEKWKLSLTVEPASGPLLVAGDASHLTQAVENLLFNARDATFEMRNHLREQARADSALDDESKRQALIAAAAWRGTATVRTLSEGGSAILEVTDNGIGMTEAVRARCTETYFTTKRDNALMQGNAAGMGLGLSFVQTILEQHHGRVEVISEPLHGATLRLILPLANQTEGATK